MRQSLLFSKTKRETPKDEVARNAELLIRAGFVYKEMAGVYTLLPLGVRVINKISEIIRQEMNKIGGIEMQSVALQRQEVWDKTRWSDSVVDNWFKTELKNGTQLGLAFTHEEAQADMMKQFIHSYKDLPVYSYDIRTIFRNEARAKSGLMRGREFFWKALYSFSRNQAEHDEFYEKVKIAYHDVFRRVGLGDRTFLTFASGGSFSKYSHEFQTLSKAGEDTIYLDRSRGVAVNEEVYNDEVLADLGLHKESMEKASAVETGNIFSLGYKFSEPAQLTYMKEDGKPELVYMGSYGIGISRLLGVLAEELSDAQGLVWPESVAPYRVHLVVLGEDEAVIRQADELYRSLNDSGADTLYDDRSVRPGEKLADADLIGLPVRVVVGARSLGSGGYEVKLRNETLSRIMASDELLNLMKE